MICVKFYKSTGIFGVIFYIEAKAAGKVAQYKIEQSEFQKK